MQRVKPLIHLIAAARPNFMKIAPLYHELKEQDWCGVTLIHTGQHYDFNMSAAFFADLGLPEPDIHLGVGAGSHAEQTAGVMTAYENVLEKTRPQWVLVAGDVNSTLACTLAAKKMGIRVAHLEAGLRSHDRSMPEEINRLVTDTLADLLLTPSPDADDNLRNEGIPACRIQRVGNIMIDSLEMLRDKIGSVRAWEKMGLKPGGYGLITLHRPSNVDHRDRLQSIAASLVSLAGRLPLIFPVHPRTSARIKEFGLNGELTKAEGLFITGPQSYTTFMSLFTKARLVLTDSGGLQEESTYLGIPCLTLRDNTERPITISQGTNRLVKVEQLEECFNEILNDKWPKGTRPEFWDGRTARRAAECLKAQK